jgi:hypothetical protein
MGRCGWVAGRAAGTLVCQLLLAMLGGVPAKEDRSPAGVCKALTPLLRCRCGPSALLSLPFLARLPASCPCICLRCVEVENQNSGTGCKFFQCQKPGFGMGRKLR